MNILSVQSHVAYGHVGNAAATFVLQRLGVEVWPVHTVQFSNHTGYDGWRGQVFNATAIRDVLAGIEERGVFPTCSGVLSGYVGEPALGEAIVEVVARVKAQNPGALYCCDPVIGDTGKGVYVRPGVLEFIATRAVPVADIVTPNQFELELLTGAPVRSLADARGACAVLHERGSAVVLVTSLATDETPADALDLIASDSKAVWRVRTPRLAISANGAGDAIAALFFAHVLRTRRVDEALSLAASSIFGILRRTMEAGSRELMLVAAQDEIVAPSQHFPAQLI